MRAKNARRIEEVMGVWKWEVGRDDKVSKEGIY